MSLFKLQLWNYRLRWCFFLTLFQKWGYSKDEGGVVNSYSKCPSYLNFKKTTHKWSVCFCYPFSLQGALL